MNSSHYPAWRLLTVFLTAALVFSPWKATSQGKPKSPVGELRLPDLDLPDLSPRGLDLSDPPGQREPDPPTRSPELSDPSVSAVTDVSTMSEALQYFVGFRFRHEPWTRFETDYVEIVRVTEDIVVLHRGTPNTTTGERRIEFRSDVLIVPVDRFDTLEFKAAGTTSDPRLRVSRLGVR
ncbi:MAG: hypothetical protein ABGY41_05540 [Candidatus Poribacteria bacterium]